MARQRMIKPEVRTSATVGQWKREVRLAWIYLWMSLDNYGYARDDLLLLKSELFPRDRDVNTARLNTWLTLMASTKSDDEDEPPLCRYEVRGRRYLHAVKWDEHQKLSHPGKREFPLCPIHDYDRNDSGSSPKPSGKVPNKTRKPSGKPPHDVGALQPEVEVEVEGEEEHLAEPAAPVAAGRTRDPIWDAVMQVCELDPKRLTDRGRGSVAKTVKELRAVAATPEQITAAARIYRRRYENATLTPSALASHWAALGVEVRRDNEPAGRPTGWEFGAGAPSWPPAGSPA